MKIYQLSADCGGFRPPKGHMDSQMFPECEGTQADRDIVKKTRERREKKKKKRKNVHAQVFPQECYCSKCGVCMGDMSIADWESKGESCDACSGRLIKAPVAPKPVAPMATSKDPLFKMAQGDVWQLESKDEEFASQMLSQIVDKALEGDETQQKFLSELWDGEGWDSVKAKVLTEGSTWYVWWMDGVRKFMSQLDTEDVGEAETSDPDYDGEGAYEPDASASSDALILEAKKKKKKKKKKWNPNPWAVCVPPDTLILGDNKNICDYEIGNGVIGQNGLQSVLTTFARPFCGKMYHIKASNMLPIIITGEHPLLASKSISSCGHINGFIENQWVSAKDLMPKTKGKDGHYVFMPILKGQISTYNIDISKFVKNNNGGWLTRHKNLNFPLNKETAWMLGLFVAEGSSCEKRKDLYVGLNHLEVQYQKRLSEAISALGFSPRIRKKRTTKNVEFSSYVLSRAFRHWCGKTSSTKRIPEFILLHNDLNILKSFLEGYIDGDGCRTEKGFSCNTVSRLLATQLQLLIARLGQISSVCEVKTKDKCVIEGRIVNQKDYFRINVHSKKGNRDINSKRILENGILFPIKSIKTTDYNGTVHNIETQDNTYLVNNLVVHNCHTTVDKDKNPEKFERCVKKVKKQQAFNLSKMEKKAILDPAVDYNIVTLKKSILDSWSTMQIAQAIKALGEESISGFSGVTPEDVPDILDMCELHVLGEIKNWLSSNVGGSKVIKTIEADGHSGNEVNSFAVDDVTEEIPCQFCGKPTINTGTKLCNTCWMVKGYLEDPVTGSDKQYVYKMTLESNPELVKKIKQSIG